LAHRLSVTRVSLIVNHCQLHVPSTGHALQCFNIRWLHSGFAGIPVFHVVCRRVWLSLFILTSIYRRSFSFFYCSISSCSAVFWCCSLNIRLCCRKQFRRAAAIECFLSIIVTVHLVYTCSIVSRWTILDECCNWKFHSIRRWMENVPLSWSLFYIHGQCSLKMLKTLFHLHVTDHHWKAVCNVHSFNSVVKCSTESLNNSLTYLLQWFTESHATLFNCSTQACVCTAYSVFNSDFTACWRCLFSIFSVTKHAREQYHVHKPYIQTISWGRRLWGCHPRCLRCQVPSF